MNEKRTLGRLGVIVAAGLVTVGLASFPAYTGADSGGNGNGNGNANDNDNGNGGDNGDNDNGDDGNGNGGVDHVVICHVPPGNPDNEHTITVGEPAVDAHVDNHGDSLGPCAADTTTTAADTTTTTSTSTTSTTTSSTTTSTTTTSSTTTSTTTTMATIAPTACDSLTEGGAGTTTTTYELGVATGTFQFTYNAGLVPDQFDIYYEDVLIHTTGSVSGSNTVPVIFGPGTETTVDVVVTGPANTLWQFTVSCPAT